MNRTQQTCTVCSYSGRIDLFKLFAHPTKGIMIEINAFDKIRNELTTTKHEKENVTKETTDKINRLNQNIANLKASNKSLKDERDSSKKDLEKLQDELKYKEKLLTQFQQMIESSMGMPTNSSKISLVELKSEISELKSQNDVQSMKKEIKNISKRLNSQKRPEQPIVAVQNNIRPKNPTISKDEIKKEKPVKDKVSCKYRDI